ncbi:MAG: hypothetical protein IPM00_18935 [Tetrasphaera sp.]|nr:hypothetical protein [Tetrasphaera sp.]
MIIIGLLLLILAAAVGTLLFIGTRDITATTGVPIFGGTLNLPPLALLIAGAITISIFWLGWALLRGGIRRSSRRRAEAKELARQEAADREAQEKKVQAEFAERERVLREERRRHEEEAAELRRLADERVAEQHLATETARQRAEVAERKLHDPTPSTSGGSVRERTDVHRSDVDRAETQRLHIDRGDVDRPGREHLGDRTADQPFTRDKDGGTDRL